MKLLLAVPVYNAEPVVHNVVKDLLENTDLPLLVVDDGSHPSLQLPKNSRLQLIHQDENRGKGVALQTAMTEARNQGYTHLLSFDGDGQHRWQDVTKLVEAAEKNPEALIIGAREFDSSVPGVSRFGRRFSNFWVKYQTGVTVSDSQSGLRLYPLQPFAETHFFTKRYDFEIEVLVRGIWKGLQVKDVNVGVIYAPKEERISHFNKFWDNVRITGINIYLIAYSLIFYQRSLAKNILAGVLAFLALLVPNPFAAVILGVLACVFLKINVIVFVVAYFGILLSIGLLGF